MSVRHLAVVNVVALFGFTTLASATPITYNYTGTVTAATGIFAGQGTNVTGTFTFDDGLVDQCVGAACDFFPSGSTANLAFNSVWEITLNLGTVNVTTATNARAVGTNHHFLSLSDDPSVDQFVMYAAEIAAGDDSVQLNLQDLLPVPPDGISPGSNNLTGTIAGAIAILNTLDPADFSLITGISNWAARNERGLQGQVVFTPTSISLAQPVPEPASLLLFGTGLVGAGVRRYRQRRAKPSAAD
jgi:hypothetical protein